MFAIVLLGLVAYTIVCAGIIDFVAKATWERDS